jgi:hypothetical protein
MPGVTGAPAGLTRQCSHSNDLSTLSPSSAPPIHKSFSFIRSSSFSFNKSHSHPDPAPIPECEKEPIFDEIRDCDEAPYPQPPQPRKLSNPGAMDIKPKAEYKSFNGTPTNNNRTLSMSMPATLPARPPPSARSSTAPMSIPPHKKKWLNKLDPRFNAKLMEERQKTIERQERERRKKREDDQVIEDLLSKWMN